MSYPNLLGQNAYFKMTEERLAELLGLTRVQFRRRMEQDSFTPDECMILCDYYNKPFEWLFARQERLNILLDCGSGGPEKEESSAVKNPIAMQKACMSPQSLRALQPV